MGQVIIENKLKIHYIGLFLQSRTSGCMGQGQENNDISLHFKDQDVMNELCAGYLGQVGPAAAT